MKATIKIITAAGIAGLALAACGTSGIKVSSGTTGSDHSTVSAQQVTVPANAPVGFNSAKTAFVLPYKLGLLPASELALAKASATYAAGLANPSDWTPVYWQAGPYMVGIDRWFYMGRPTTKAALSATLFVKTDTVGWSEDAETLYGVNQLKVVHSTTARVIDSTLNVLISVNPGEAPQLIPERGNQLVVPSTLEVEAAPVGTLIISGAYIPAICVPTPEAYLANNTPATISGLPVMTAGPSTVFAGVAGINNSSDGWGMLYNEGVASCANFH